MRQFQSPFTTIYLEDETGFGSSVALAVNQQNNAGSSGLFNQSGSRIGVLPPGRYELEYELEGRDDDLDGIASSTSNGSVRLVLRKPTPPTNLLAQTNGLAVGLSWGTSPDATAYQLEAGSAPGLSDLFNGNVGNVTALQTPAPAGTYFVRVRAITLAGASAASNEVSFTLAQPGACIAPPPAPTGHSVQISGLNVVLSWNASPSAVSYVLQAGSGSGLANLFNANTGPGTSLAAGAPAGMYFTRIRAVNACGTSGPSNELQFTLGCTSAPPAPGSFTFAKAGNLLTLNWSASVGAATYQILAGTAPGLSNALSADFGGATSQQFNVSGVPAGTYFVRIVAQNACGASGPSNEVTIPIP